MKAWMIAAALLAAGTMGHATESPCPPGRFVVVAGAALAPGGPAAPQLDEVALGDGARVAIPGCDAVPAKVKAKNGATTVVAKWKRCRGLKKLRLKGTIAGPACDRLEGTIKARKRPSTPFVATRSRCGDALLDPVGAEACDDGGTTSGDGCSATCAIETCGDGIVTPGLGETCEPTGAGACPGACQSNCVCAAAFTAIEDLQPCDASAIDGWTFPVSAGDEVYVRADTTRADTAADLLFFVSCNGEPLLDADDEVACSFAPPQFACPEGRVTTVAGGTCRVDVGVFFDPDLGSTCTDAARVDYGLVVQVDRAPAALELVVDDDRPASPSGAFVD